MGFIFLNTRSTNISINNLILYVQNIILCVIFYSENVQNECRSSYYIIYSIIIPIPAPESKYNIIYKHKIYLTYLYTDTVRLISSVVRRRRRETRLVIFSRRVQIIIIDKRGDANALWRDLFFLNITPW